MSVDLLTLAPIGIFILAALFAVLKPLHRLR